MHSGHVGYSLHSGKAEFKGYGGHTVEWSDSVLFSIFKNLHISVDHIFLGVKF